jgi:UDP-N-acetylglucosamine--N-acetylmuramyl-(pentapeptide) pyrophosphoryl-undecaprenol N-acetylglucosamine transferase
MRQEVVITCGGTGGHIYPGLAVAEALVNLGVDVRFVGSDNRMEKDKIPAEGYTFEGLPVRPLNKRRPFQSLLNLWLATGQARQSLRRSRPLAVLGLGSYITVPVILAAWYEKIPIILLDTNVVPGLANRYLARLATCVALAHAQTARYLPSGVQSQVTGSPIRPAILTGDRTRGEALFALQPECITLIVMGGSQGAQRLNQVILEILPELLNINCLQVVHMCGTAHLSAVREAAGQYAGHPRYRLLNYVDNMPDLLACADVAISRAGASMIAELLACRIPSVLVPGSFGGGHQMDNARALADAGAAMLLTESELSGSALMRLLRDIILNQERLNQMRECCGRLNSPRAAEQVAHLIQATISDSIKEAHSC